VTGSCEKKSNELNLHETLLPDGGIDGDVGVGGSEDVKKKNRVCRKGGRSWKSAVNADHRRKFIIRKKRSYFTREKDKKVSVR